MVTRQQNKDDKKKDLESGSVTLAKNMSPRASSSRTAVQFPSKTPFAKSDKEISLTNVDCFAAGEGKKTTNARLRPDKYAFVLVRVRVGDVCV